ncbi:MAG TPA: hypothetical protein VF997_16025 [Polyangia bacterium]
MTRPPPFPTGQVVRIAILVVLLVAVVFMKSRCGPAANNLFKAFDAPPTTDGGLTSSDAARK